MGGAQDAERVEELVGRRTATSNTFLMDDGSLETVLFEAPVNYRDESGDWQPIDQGLEQGVSGAIVNGDNSFDLSLPSDLDQAPIKASIDGAWVSEQPVGIQAGAAELSEQSTASYATGDEATTFEFEGLSNGLKETIELAGPEAPMTYHFRLDASSGVVPELGDTGSVAFRDQDGKLIAVMPAPFMVDGAGIQAPVDAVRYSLDGGAEGPWMLAVEADPEWLRAEGRSWPVAIDPSITFNSMALDCTIASHTETTMCGYSVYPSLTTRASYLASGENQYSRSLLRFNFGNSSLPAAASIQSAALELYAPSAAKNVTKVDLYDVSRSWEALTYPGGAGPAWKYWGPNHTPFAPFLWAKEGGDFGKYMPTPASVTPAERGGSQAGWWKFSSWDLTNLVERWRLPAPPPDYLPPNNGLLLKLADETPRVCCIERRLDWESSAGTNKPRLVVQYVLPFEPANKARVTSPSDGTKTAKRFLLTSSWDVSGVEGVTFQYKKGNTWTEIPSAQVLDGNNKNVTWPYPVVKSTDRVSRPLYWNASSLIAGSESSAKVQIRALLAGPAGANGYTKAVEAEINRDIGGIKDGAVGVGPGSVDLLTGNFTVSRTDVAIPGLSSLSLSRSFSSREPGAEATGIFGPGWSPAASVSMAGDSPWTKVKVISETIEGEKFSWAELTRLDGKVFSFEEGENGQFLPTSEVNDYLLYRMSESQIGLAIPGGERTVFSNNGSGGEYLPVSISTTGGTGNQTKAVYEVVSGKRRLKQLIGATAPGIWCDEYVGTTSPGCRVLTFTYQSATTWGAPASAGDRLQKVVYYAPGISGGPWEVARYAYDNEGRLVSAWDPRLSQALGDTYAYTAGGRIKTLTEGGFKPWSLEYGTITGDPGLGRLVSVSRETLVAGHPTAQTTIAYGVPLTGGSGRADMQPAAVAAWGQKDLPTDATAIFPPDEVPASPPSSYARATIYYMDAEGQVSNVASPAGAGTSEPSITTTEADKFGNVVRELTARNRVRALSAGSGSVAKSQELDIQYAYSPDGIELQEELGPVHLVRIEATGATEKARLHRSIQYDKGAPTPGANEAGFYLPTTETTSAQPVAGGPPLDKRSTEFRYNWTLREPTEAIADPEGSEETISVTVYDPDTGRPVQKRQPKNTAGGGAGTTKFVYYKTVSTEFPECQSSVYAGLPCRIEPAAQPGTPGQPQLPVKKFRSYNQLGEALEITESPGGGSENVRKTVFTYDAGGRPLTKETVGGGIVIPKVETTYSTTYGLPTTQRFICPGSEPSCDTQATTTSYDALGRVTSYQDADGNTSTTGYDYLSRPTSINDGKGTQTLRYDSTSGLLIEVEDSAAGVFTASYDADGQLVKRGLPNGLSAETTFDETGSAVGLTYTKASNCGTSCTWLNFAVERSVRGQILLENGTLGGDEYAYDKLGRLITGRETPPGGTCTTRSYKYDKDSNREELRTSPGIGATCSSSGGTTQAYSYDSADRLLAAGLTYDSFGRITALPANLAGGNPLSTTYFSNGLVASQSQNGVTNTYQLDAVLRHRQRLQAGGLQGTEVFHYASPGDSPSWTERGSTWTRNIVGIGGELAAVQESGKEITLSLTNLNGNVVAAAAINPAVTALKGTFSYDEFGTPTSGTAGRFGWLGGLQRRTELPSGVVQMGARSYVPSIGRFLSTDPIAGGSANAYDYANQDPINSVDPGGLKPYDSGQSGPCRGKLHVWSNKIGSRDGYGKFQVRYGMNCGVDGYHVRVLKIIRRFENLTRNQIELESVNEPARPGSPHYNGYWGNWYDGPSTKFDCVNGQEYQYTYEIVFEYSTPVVICGRKDCAGESSGGSSLALQAQEFCGHGPY